MARRTKKSAAEDLADLIALLPWWAGVSLALAAYLVLHHLASQPIAVVAKPGQMSQAISQSMFRALATFGQYVVPMICLIGAALSAWRRRERRQVLDTASANPTASAIDGMSWRQFEHLVGEVFRMQGYRVVETGGAGADGGVDLVVTKDGETYLVQCKQWRAFRVGVEVVRELYGVMAAKGAAGGFVVTSGRFTEESVAFAEGRNVRLIDGHKLHGLINQVRRASSNEEVVTSELNDSLKTTIPSTAFLMPSCPLCSRPMARRVARRGSRAGSEFWGCTGFPGCRGILPV